VPKGDDASQSQAVLFISCGSIFILIAYRLDPEHKEVLAMLTPQTKLLKNRKTLTVVLVLGFVLEKNSVPTELDEFRENSDEFRTQFGEFSECEA
jgi:hypothetical protein